MHGGTATQPITFRSALKVISEEAHTVSEYPVIITLENHCTSVKRNDMAVIIKEELSGKAQIHSQKHSSELHCYETQRVLYM